VSLIGVPLRIAAVVVVVVALAAAVRLAPLVAGGRTSHVLARIGLIVGCQLCVVVAVLVLVNASFDFYGSWGDLFGTPGSATDATGGGTLPAIGSGTDGPGRRLAPVTRDPAAPQYRLAAGQGRIEDILIHGVRTRITMPAFVYLPPQYFLPANRAQRFPVTVAFTGYPGNAQNLITHLKLPQTAAREIAARRMPPVIFVMLQPTVAPPRDTECTDVPHGPQAETFFAEDVPAAIASAYRTATSASGWGAMGDSTGGYCAVKLAMRHSDRYSTAVSLAGTYHALRDFTTKDLYGASRPYRAENDLIWRLRHRQPPPVNLLLTTTRTGERDYAQTRLFLSLVRPPTHAASITLPVGGHHFSTWRRELPPALNWLGAHLQ
jgi:S-formylglutathione hydrolase FrmB